MVSRSAVGDALQGRAARAFRPVLVAEILGSVLGFRSCLGLFVGLLGQFRSFLGAVLELLGAWVGASWERLGATWGLLGASSAHLGASWKFLGAEGSDFQFVFPLLGFSWGRLEGLAEGAGR